MMRNEYENRRASMHGAICDAATADRYKDVRGLLVMLSADIAAENWTSAGWHLGQIASLTRDDILRGTCHSWREQADLCAKG